MTHDPAIEEFTRLAYLGAGLEFKPCDSASDEAIQCRAMVDRLAELRTQADEPPADTRDVEISRLRSGTRELMKTVCLLSITVSMLSKAMKEQSDV